MGIAVGEMLDIRIEGDAVELHGVGTWMVRSQEPPNDKTSLSL